MKAYMIAKHNYADDLAADVEALMRDGWEPLGGVAVTSHYEQWENARKGYTESETFVLYAQAMVRDESASAPEEGETRG